MQMITNQIKLIIWDMDDTFWDGTISEGEVKIPQKHIDIIRELTDRGIMNSISSKNDFQVVRDQLVKNEIWDFFVFPAINWENKGPQIADIIKKCNLRAVNCLYIDDNPHNLNEALHYCSDLYVAGPEVIDELLDNPCLVGKHDRDHTRLKQFKVLEEKSRARGQFDSNEEFLYMSDIRVEMKYDCREHADRLLDLINRSNQLNYTKVRLTKQELEALLEDMTYNVGYVSVRDKYGDYGIVGFFAVKDGTADHFLFSCRTIGIGVEQWVYACLGYPKVKISGEVITPLTKEGKPGWINRTQSAIITAKKADTAAVQKKILMRGGAAI
jgi:FkbH-like protein